MSIFDNPVGKNFGPYRVVDKVGRGGMAAVFRAVHEPDDGLVALKVFTPPDGDTTEFFKRAKREVVALQMCSHPNILKVHGFEFEGEAGYVAVEYIEGQNLQEISEAQGPQKLDQLLRIGRDVGGALAYIHARGLFHRDLKPANIMLENGTGRCVLLDFGIVKATNLTQISGFQKEVMGTLTYMAPEQFLTQEVDGRTDLYQLGLVLYRLATADDPPPVMDLVEKADRGGNEALLPVRGRAPELPEAFETVLTNLTHPQKEGRYSTAHEFLKDVQKLAAGEPVAARPVAPVKKAAPASKTTGGHRAPPSGAMSRPPMRPGASALRSGPNPAFKPPPATGRITGPNKAVTNSGPTGAVAKVTSKVPVPAAPVESNAKKIGAVAAVLVAVLAVLWKLLH